LNLKRPGHGDNPLLASSDEIDGGAIPPLFHTCSWRST
jgi:hypothetical protein